MDITSVRFEHHREPLGIGEPRPRLSWLTSTDVPGWRQAAYEVEMVDGDAGATWSSGRVDSAESVLVPWPGAPLRSRERRRVRVRVWGDDGAEPSAWSDWHVVEAGLLDAADWTAQLIGPDWDEAPDRSHPPALFRHEFELPGPVESARLYATAHGLYEVELNGAVVGDQVLAPGWTSYHHRLRYQTYDVTGLLREGPNALGATVAEGWFRGRLTWKSKRNVYGDRAGLLAQLEVRLADGRTVVVGTDETWRCATGPILEASLYDGETYDARLERPGWSAPGYDDTGWSGSRRAPVDRTRLVAPTGPPVRRTQVLRPAAILTSPSGRTIVDFGQNLVGRVRLRVSGPAGHVVTLRHAEVLENDELGVRPLRTARATDRYTLAGRPEGEEWEPRFTFHGFRYAEVDGWPGELTADDVTAVVVHTDVERTGWFEASEPLLERLHENVVWSLRGNLVDVPTDCPQRDERLGWTGDLQVFAPAASFLFDCAGPLTSWLRDLAAEQLASPDRLPPVVVPNVLDDKNDAAAWGDATVVVPWVLYRRFGDLQLLRDQFPSMTAWVDGIAERAGESGIWDGDWQYGDWLDPSAPPDDPAAARTDPALVATAYLARSAAILADAAALIGEHAASERYADLAARVRRAFAAEYVTPNGRLAGDTQTGFALALQFALLETPEQRERAGRRLVELVHDGRYRIGTGFVGTPLIADALCTAGATQVAYRLLLETSCPSFLYPVTMGATTIWERWDSMLPDGTVNPGEMTSFNHYALGAVADWLHRVVAGLAPGAPGYRHLVVAPRPGGDLTSAGAVHLTPYGRASVRWSQDGDAFTLDVEVPPNCTATVRLPGGAAHEVAAGRHRFEERHEPAPYPPVVERPRNAHV
ncbi:glycoside hydrolase family 78 protein [Jiangella rhizosphaerae]|uniref:alpha-L-rhamnosidase n=1 Tax=Jiangella rhizosphaerae TaxID=2293569 RepID=A0A418KJX4_9ACTN|nr:glycoside hydrolase family 78 protein [Jiangella rhizosphaerae]RIQ14550.1 alpha-L-rhamnosidase [Jiangella rhizosphaerae]